MPRGGPLAMLRRDVRFWWVSQNWRKVMSNRKYHLAGLVALSALVTVNEAAFAEIVWSCNAMGAVPTPPTVQQDLIVVQAGKVSFNEGKTGTANLVCPIGTLTSRLHGPLHGLSITFAVDAGAGAVAEASLRRVDRNTGHVETVENGHVTSEGHNPLPGHWRAESTSGITDSLDDPRFIYYVQITLKRTSPNPDVSVQGVTLTAS